MRQDQQTDDRNEAAEAPVDGRAFAVFGGLMLATLIATLDTQIVATALPSIARDLGGIGQFAWVSTSYLLTLSVSTLLAGKLAHCSREAGDAGSDRDLPRRIGGVRCRRVDERADRLPRDPGNRRRRDHGHRVRYSWRPVRPVRPAAACPVPGLQHGRVRGLQRDRSPDRRLDHRPPRVAVGVLCQPPCRPGCCGNPHRAAAAARLRSRQRQADRIDYAGITVLAAAITCLAVMANWAGTRYAWTSATIASLALAAVSLLVAFGVIEHRAAEPVIPPRLLRDSTVAISTIVAFAAGFVGLGALNYLSLFLQQVTGTSAQDAGLLLLPLTAGLLVASVTAGQLISRTGRYRWYPAASMAVAAVAAYLLSTMDAKTSLVISAIFLGILGLGIGLSPERRRTGRSSQRSAGPAWGGNLGGHLLPHPRRVFRHRRLRSRT